MYNRPDLLAASPEVRRKLTQKVKAADEGYVQTMMTWAVSTLPQKEPPSVPLGVQDTPGGDNDG